jgi:hypothetical protein
MAAAEDEDVVKALSSKGADPAFCDGVRLRRTDGSLHDSESFRAKDLVEGARELGVSIPEQDVLLPKVSRDREVPSLLGDPGRVRSAGRAGYVDPSGREFDEE